MANTTADKLAKLTATKADLKAALAEKGQTVGDVFSTYPAAVRATSAGGGGYASADFYEWMEAEKGFGIVVDNDGYELFCFPSFQSLLDSVFSAYSDSGIYISANASEIVVECSGAHVEINLGDGTIEVYEGSVSFYTYKP